MCGITGYVNWRGVPEGDSIIKGMITPLARRGPDGNGVWVGGNVALGHTRLSIIDLAGGAQPMLVQGKRGRLVITFNGELFNYRELREQLKAHGHIFESASDTEVIMRAYDEWGVDCVRHFTGMFAFAIWDDDAKELFMARDPLGVKPLYYYKTAHGMVFGSEEKALLAHPEVPAEIDHTGIAELFCMVPMVNPNGAVFRGFTQVRPGYSVMVSAARTITRCYWKLEALPHTDTEEQTVKKLRSLFEQSVQSQLVADVPLGSMLSGGVDSSAVAAFAAKAQRAAGKQLPTFDIDYDVTDHTSYASSALHVDRDNPWALKVAAHIGSQHSTHFVTVDDLLGAHQATLEAWGRPQYSPVNVSLYLLFKHIRASGVRTLLGGEGADEAVAGYRWWRDMDDVLYDGFPWHRTYRQATYLLRPDLQKQINPADYVRQQYIEAIAQVPRLSGESAHNRRMREISWLTYTYYLNFLLHRVDRMSMAASVEARVPFCDHNFVQYAWNIPWDIKNTGDIEKGVLRRAIEDLLPKEVVWRRKSGYPVAQMQAYQKALWDAMRLLLKSPNEPLWQLADHKAAQKVIDEQEGNINEWSWLNHVSYMIETNEWLKRVGVRVLL